MGNPLFLTADELADLTDRVRAAEQIRWLRDRGYPFEMSASGRPKVLRQEIETRLTSVSPRKGATKKKEPNFRALREAG